MCFWLVHPAREQKKIYKSFNPRIIYIHKLCLYLCPQNYPKWDPANV